MHAGLKVVGSLITNPKTKITNKNIRSNMAKHFSINIFNLVGTHTRFLRSLIDYVKIIENKWRKIHFLDTYHCFDFVVRLCRNICCT